jgi:pyruvate formate lyase activating enzyme
MRAKYFETDGGKVKCVLCPHKCVIDDGGYGFCGTRRNLHGILYSDSYGKFTSLALDPIEKKPLYHFYSGSKILSAGSYGCNMKCGFCQNHKISQFDFGKGCFDTKTDFVSPENLLRFAETESKENIGIAFTYNEPALSFEYILDTAPLFHRQGYKVILVSNGQINAEPLAEILPFTDAWNIDVKAFNADFYRKHGGDFETAKRTVETAAKTAHVEVTTLIIPNENDSDEEISALADWLSGISSEIPLHLSGYFPRYKYSIPPTAKETLLRLSETAKRKLKYVYLGNV